LPAPYTFPGLIGALIFAVVSFLPSLLPRSGLFQGVLTGVTAAIGYALGVFIAWIVREIADRPARPASQRSWRILLAVAVLLLGLAVYRGQQWQGDIRDLMGQPTPGPAWIVLLPVATVGVFVLLVAVSRLLRRGYRALARLLDRWIGERAARAIGWAVVALVTVGVLSGVVYDGFLSAADRIFAVNNGITPDGVEQPTLSTRSSGPGSDIAWDSLGREGRKFIGGGPASVDITEVTGEPAQEPIRAYAGLETAPDSESRAKAAVDDLERAGGFDRDVLVVATTTGSGWIDPAASNTIEYLANGDSAIVSMQYSYLPSWLSFLVDQQRAREAGRDLFDAVYERWADLPANDRPRLIAFGESLGSFGGETAFSGEADMRIRTDGVVFAGPPNFNTLWREFTDARDAGTPEILPTFREGRTVRFRDEPDGPAPPADRPWDGTRVLYLQHPSDPIVWWSPDLLLTEPDWLREPRGSDVLPEVQWFPFVTFWQVTLDMPRATAVPSGHGHTYSREYVDAFAAVLRSDADEAELEALRVLADDVR
jgi:uncharacterized membrane protein